MLSHSGYSWLRSIAVSLFISTFLSLGLTNAVFAQAPAEAGKVILAIGDVKVSRGGQVLALTKGASLQAGDGVITGIASNAQLRMSDGAVIALRAQSEFKINQYSFNGKTDGSEKAELSLVKGGVRAVTGAIGRENKDNLKINAVVATVGIRGTGFNINVCEANCFNPDKTPVKDGLYAGVFEGKIIVKNQAAAEAVGVNQYLYVADKDTAPKFILAPPNFLPDPLTGQKSAKPKGKSEAATEIPSLAVAVSAPAQPADTAVPVPTSALPSVTGVVVTQPPFLSSTTSPFAPTVVYNNPQAGSGSAPVPPIGTTYPFILQKAETWAGFNDTDGLPVRSNTPGLYLAAPVGTTYDTGFTTTNSASGLQATSITIDPTCAGPGSSCVTSNVPGPGTSPYKYAINPSDPAAAQQLEGGNWAGVVSWGRWANGTVLEIGGYNNGQPIYMPSSSGFHYIVGEPTSLANLATLAANHSILNFSIVGATTPTPITNPQGSWSVTGGSLTANFASAQITGNLGLYANQPTGYGFYNMTYSGGLSSSTPINNVSTFVSKLSGSLGACAAGCAGTGNVAFYGNGTVNGVAGAQAAGLSYNFNTGGNIVQGVAVFKR